MIDTIGFALCCLVPAAVVGYLLNWCVATYKELNED